MRYVIADRGKVTGFGVNAVGHRTKDTRIVINEKELAVVPGASVADKVTAIGGTLYSISEIKQVLQEEGWQ